MPARKYFETAGPGGYTRRIRIPVIKTTFHKVAHMGYIKFSEYTQRLNRCYRIVTRPEINDAWNHVLEERMNVEVADGNTLTEEQKLCLKLAGDQQFSRNVDRYWAMKAQRNKDLPHIYFEVAAYQDPVILALLNESRSSIKEDEDMAEEQPLGFHTNLTEHLVRQAIIQGWTEE